MSLHSRRRALASLAVASLVFFAAPQVTSAQNRAQAPSGFQLVSDLVELPEFVPGLGVLYVNPETLPAGPFYAYDRDGRQVSTIYMIPLDKMNEREAFNGLDVSSQRVDHVDVHYNAGHPGIPAPHYHIILWHVSKERAARLSS